MYIRIKNFLEEKNMLKEENYEKDKFILKIKEERDIIQEIFNIIRYIYIDKVSYLEKKISYKNILRYLSLL